MKILTNLYPSMSMEEAQTSAVELAQISQRLTDLEMRTLGYSRSSAPTLAALDTGGDDDSINTTKAANEANKGGIPPEERVETVLATRKRNGKEPEDHQGSSFSFTFDQDLNNSRPYVRAMKRNSMWSIASSAAHTTSWSCLSGLSLAEISDISVIGLPISIQELWNGHHYITADTNFTRPIGKTEPPVTDGLANGGNQSLSENVERSLVARKGTVFHNGVQSLGVSPAFDTDRHVQKPPVTAGGSLIEPKRIILLGTNPIQSRWN